MLKDGVDYKNFEHDKWKYITIREVVSFTMIFGHDIKTEYFHLTPGGHVTVFAGYAWDGCTGVPDLKSTMLASLLHDIGYQCLREELLLDWDLYSNDLHHYYKDFAVYLKRIDELFEWTMEQDGAWWITRKIYYNGVRILGEVHAMPKRLLDAD